VVINEGLSWIYGPAANAVNHKYTINVPQVNQHDSYGTRTSSAPGGSSYEVGKTSAVFSGMVGAAGDSLFPEPQKKPPYKAAAAGEDLAESGLGVNAGFSRTEFSAIAAPGITRSADDYGVTLSYGRDFGRWGYMVSLPLRAQRNNSLFEAFDNMSFGIAFLPQYHLLLPQVHGFGLDLGVVAALDHRMFENKSKLTDANGLYQLSSFDNPSSFQVGPAAHLNWSIGGTTLTGTLSHIYIRNLANTGLFGSDSGLTIVGAGIRQVLWEGGSAGIDGTYNRLHHIGAGDPTYMEGSLYLQQSFGGRNSLGLRVSRTGGNDDFTTTGIMLQYSRELN
jgi:hypothetical protein